MTPGLLTTPIFPGAKWEHTLTFRQSGTATPVNLTGLTPLVMQFRNTAGAIIASATVTVVGDAPANGQVVVLLTAAQTNTFPLGTGTVNAGIRDALNNPYAQGTLDVKPFTPDPATI